MTLTINMFGGGLDFAEIKHELVTDSSITLVDFTQAKECLDHPSPEMRERPARAIRWIRVVEERYPNVRFIVTGFN